MANLRLAIVTPRFWPLVGDSPTHLLRMAEWLAAAGHLVTVVTPRWHRSWPCQMSMGAMAIVRLPGSPRGGLSTLRWRYALTSWLSKQRFDAIIVGGLKHEADVALTVTRGTNTSVVLLAGEDDLAWHQSAALGARIAQRCYEASSTIAPSHALADDLVRAGWRAECIEVISRQGVPSDPRSPQRREEARAALVAANYDLVSTVNTQVALMVGRLESRGRWGDAVRAWRIVTARRPEARLWIVGDGPERETLYRQIGDLDQRFRIFIPGTFDSLDDLFHAADLLLVTVPYTAPPLAILDGRAQGLPVIAADAPAATEYVAHQKTGIIYPLGDVRSLADSVLALMDHPATAVNYGAAAREQSRIETSGASEATQFGHLLDRLGSSP